MAVQNDVQAATRTTTGELVGGRARVRSLHYRSTATAGTVVLKDGGASGTTLLTINSPAAVGSNDLVIPDQGILFKEDVHVTLTNVNAVTIIYA